MKQERGTQSTGRGGWMDVILYCVISDGPLIW